MPSTLELVAHDAAVAVAKDTSRIAEPESELNPAWGFLLLPVAAVGFGALVAFHYFMNWLLGR